MTRQAGLLLLLTMFLVSTAFSMPTSTPTDNSVSEEHDRDKRQVLLALTEVGCTAFTSVRKCTKYFDGCGDFCHIVDNVCTVASIGSDLVNLLCEKNMHGTHDVVMVTFWKCRRNNQKDAENFLQAVGSHIKHTKSVWEKISDVVNSIGSWFKIHVG